MTTKPGQSLEEVSAEAMAAISALESRLTLLASHVEDIRHDVDATRVRTQREREDLDIEYSLETGHSYVVEAPHAEDLRRAERELVQRTLQAARLHRQLTEFTALITTTQRLLGTGDEFAGPDAATQAAIRSAAAMAQETERHRLAREIHDGPAQALANAIIALEFVERAIRGGGDSTQVRALEEVERIKSTLREGLTEIRRFIFDLRPTMLQDRGFTATVEHYIATYQSLFPMPIDFTCEQHLPRMTNEQELTAFRVVQESIQNARKHARASRTVVDVRHRANNIIVTVADNGRGFSPERVTAHMMGGVGLRGMHERAALVGGSIKVESEPGEGTRIELTIPLRAVDTPGMANLDTDAVLAGDSPADIGAVIGTAHQDSA